VNAKDSKARAHALIGSAQACVELHQFRRAEEELVRAIAEVKACDRMEVEERERKKQQVWDAAAQGERKTG